MFKFALRIDQDLDFPSEEIIELVKELNGWEVESVERKNYGIGADFMVALTAISTALGIVRGIDTIIKLPDTIKKINDYIENWEEVSFQYNKLVSHITSKFDIVSYSLHCAFSLALDDLTEKGYDVQKASLIKSHEFSCHTCYPPDYPRNFDHSGLTYYTIVIEAGDYYHYYLINSKLEIITYKALHSDPRQINE